MVIYVIGALATGWLLFLSWIVFSMRSHYTKLVSRTKNSQIDAILDSLIENDTIGKKDFEVIKKEIDTMRQEMQFHIQKVDMVRFSPFEKRGGQESFVLSLLDKTKTGVVLNFMYTPDGLRVYSKKIESGKGAGIALTDEEEEALK